MKGAAVTVLNEANFNNNNNNSRSISYSNNKSKKSVRFAPDDELQINKTAFTNTFKIGEYCKKCGSLRVGPYVENGCKNCTIPKPSRQYNEYVNSRSKIDFLNERQQHHQQGQGQQVTTEVEIENTIPEILDRLNAGESLEEACLKVKPIMPIMPTHPRTSLTRPVVYKCHACNGILQPGEIAILAEKVDKNLRWHPGCFACTICNELLVDLLYFNIGSDVYCEKHFDEIISWRKCAACDLPIKSNEYVCAENNYWHIEHFVCWNCDCSLAGQKYTVIDSMPYCFNCHERIFAKTCVSCNKKILPDQVRLTYEKLNWHSDPNCFKCHVCNIDLLESHFILKKNLLFCSLDCKKKAVKN